MLAVVVTEYLHNPVQGGGMFYGGTDKEREIQRNL